MKKTDLEILRCYLIEYLGYLCKEDRLWDMDEILTVIHSVNDTLGGKYDTKD